MNRFYPLGNASNNTLPICDRFYPTRYFTNTNYQNGKDTNSGMETAVMRREARKKTRSIPFSSLKEDKGEDKSWKNRFQCLENMVEMDCPSHGVVSVSDDELRNYWEGVNHASKLQYISLIKGNTVEVPIRSISVGSELKCQRKILLPSFEKFSLKFYDEQVWEQKFRVTFHSFVLLGTGLVYEMADRYRVKKYLTSNKSTY